MTIDLGRGRCLEGSIISRQIGMVASVSRCLTKEMSADLAERSTGLVSVSSAAELVLDVASLVTMCETAPRDSKPGRSMEDSLEGMCSRIFRADLRRKDECLLSLEMRRRIRRPSQVRSSYMIK